MGLFAVGASAQLNFLVMGDWGGLPGPIWSTPAEHSTADAMNQEAAKIGATFALALGDNFYENGIKTDEHDSRFKHTFEDVFDGGNLKAENFFKVLAGNHDHYGNVSAQIAYSAISDRWHFPSLYYSWVETGPDFTAEFVQLDTVTLSGDSSDPITGEEMLGTDPRMAPADPIAAGEQYAWLNATLAASTADFIFVSGHFPVWSVCEHGPTGSLVTTLKPILEAHGVSAYFAGHDHCEEHIDDNGGVQYHVVGAANQNGGNDKNKDKIPADQLKFLDIGTPIGVHFVQGGFGSVTIASKAAGAVVKHFRTAAVGDGYKTMYTAPPIAARSGPAVATAASLRNKTSAVPCAHPMEACNQDPKYPPACCNNLCKCSTGAIGSVCCNGPEDVGKVYTDEEFAAFRHR